MRDDKRNLYVYHKGEYVGWVDDCRNDMWYMEGKWCPADTVAAANFTNLMVAQEWEQNFKQGEGELVLYSEEEEGKQLDGLAMGLVGSLLIVRMLLPETAEIIRQRK
ncbi:MAG: hypothetical protein H0T73_15720 [Ardenticatenales bacterium]|nr:hypothetical protein [Ardenticatenales bacterium]